ncbi:MAG: CRISPR-associated protein Cas4 [Chloroflexi bacterium]|nr:CRISPR-associated protein Cas4 [Chloroflexota bacterium]
MRMLALTVTDIKQYHYCQRIAYYTYCLPVPRHLTYKVQEGEQAHQRQADLEHRRTLSTYGVTAGERHLGVLLRSERLGLSGRLDMAILTPAPAGEVIPVEFKNTTPARLGMNHKYQLAAYALLVEEVWQRPARRGFLYFIPEKQAQEVVMTAGMRRHVARTLAGIRRIATTETLPLSTAHRGRCVDCEYRRYCNDID